MTDLRALLFPPEGRSFSGKRWASIACRTAHLVGMAGVSGGMLLDVAPEVWQGYLALTVASGMALLLLDSFTSLIWVVQVRGLSVLAKLGALACLGRLEDHRALLIVLVVVLSGLSSHAPARVRYFSVLHGRVVDTWE